SVPPRPAPPADPVHRAVAEQVAALLTWDRAVRADADDAVHQMRVTIRQIRSLLQASEEEFGLTDDATILSELRELAAILGVARDAEVLAERYREALDALPAELVRGPVRRRLVDGGWQRYRTGLDRSLKAMRSARYFRLLDALDDVVVSSPPRDEEHPHATITSGFRRVRRRLATAQDAATEHDREEALHRVRKAAKRLRYVAAATGAKEVSDRAKTIQSLLGDHQDSVVSRAHLLAEAAAAHAAGEDTFTYGVLHQREEELAQACREGLDSAVKELRRSVRKATSHSSAR
ncbi:MAG: CHAD domain-containing protein, partial [Mycobacterium sp.]|nr:CHAD domain-containing protein [Mycobacterium sp.]